MTPKEQAAALVMTVRAVADAIKELKEVPSGHLYAHVMNHLSLDTYERIIVVLVKSGVITKSGDLLKWNVKV